MKLMASTRIRQQIKAPRAPVHRALPEAKYLLLRREHYRPLGGAGPCDLAR